MKFNCPKCKKEFALSDKLKGKTLKVRCTSCGSAFKMKVVARSQAPAAAKKPAKSTARFHPDSAAKAREEVERDEAKAAARKAKAQRTAPPKLAAVPPAAKPTPPPVPPPAPEPKPGKWYAIVAKTRLGPMPFGALKRLIADGKVTSSANVWRKGMKAWVPAGTVSELDEYLAAIPAPPPVPETVPEPKPEPQPAPEPKPEPKIESKPEPAPEVEKAAVKPSGDPSKPRSDESAPWELSTPFNDPAAEEEIAKVLEVSEGDSTGAEPPAVADVEISTLDASFFDSAPEVPVLPKGEDEIVLLDGPAFPMELEEHHVDKDARASLKDFSVMVRLSRRNRTKQVGLLIGLGAVAVAALFAIFTFGDPLAVIFPEKEYHAAAQGDFKGLFSEYEKRQAEKKQKEAQKEKVEKKAARDQSVANADELLKSMQDEVLTVSFSEDELGLDKERFASKLKEKKGRHKPSDKKRDHTKKRVDKRHKPVDEGDDGELSLSELAAAEERKKTALDGSTISNSGGANSGKVVDGMDSSMGKVFGGPSHLKERKIDASVAKREGDGSSLKIMVAKRVGAKVRGKRKHLQRCVENHSGYAGSGASLRINLHFSDKGEVRKVSVKDGNDQLEACFQEAFHGWRLSMVNRKIKIPIALKFQ